MKITLHHETSSSLASIWLLLASDSLNKASLRETPRLHLKSIQGLELPKRAKKEIEHELNSETGPLYIRSRDRNLSRRLHVDGKKSRPRYQTWPSELEKAQRLTELSQRAHWPAPQINPKPRSLTPKSRTVRTSLKKRDPHCSAFLLPKRKPTPT
jgi:hypothetical protein